ncbi:hypothetical protein CC2G_002310 [Coprinopsis cinerea AmutBmut pab1-1]|nr:hypothetical protein CC2G_002310 [Coprinopsis cinerea AmutBmut pab1-1]
MEEPIQVKESTSAHTHDIRWLRVSRQLNWTYLKFTAWRLDARYSTIYRVKYRTDDRPCSRKYRKRKFIR